MRVPFIIRWPDRIAPGSRCDLTLSNVDLAPTLLELARVPLPDRSVVLDGTSFAAACFGKEIPSRDSLIEIGYSRAVVSNGWKYIATRIPPAILAKSIRPLTELTPSGDIDSRGQAGKFPHHNEPDQLYDLTSDPFEQHILVHDPAHAVKLDDLRRRLVKLMTPLPHPYAEFKKAGNKSLHPMRTFITLFLIAFAVDLTAAETPHILCLTVDDMSCDSVNALGNPMPGLTPNIDRLAREGFLCKDAHVPSSVCGPSRQLK